MPTHTDEINMCRKPSFYFSRGPSVLVVGL